MSFPLIKVSATVGVLGFLGYCIYFDRKRRSDPDFKEKLRAKRQKEKKSAQSNSESEIPIFTDPGHMQAYFLKQVELSDDLMQNGNFEEAVLHLANATVVCTQKNEFLAVMQKSLPPSVFELLINYYQIANQKYIKKVFQSQDLSGLKKQSSSQQQQQQQHQFVEDNDIE